MSDVLNKLKDLINKPNAKYGIENILKAYHFLNDPLKNTKIIHVAGTNGKGSVCYKIAKSLSLSGYKVGLFTSPHISSIRERIMVDFALISDHEFENELDSLFYVLEPLEIDLNFFEVITLLACNFFHKKAVDFAVIEVGLGGRLDATNVLSSDVSVITSIGYDHQHLLGNSLDQIACEKAGIIKPNVPVILGPKALYQVIIEKAQELSAPLYTISDKDFVTYDEENQAIAKQVLEILKKSFPISSKSIHCGISERPKCRLEVYDREEMKRLFPNFPKKIIFDVAHNVDGLKRLKQSLDKKFGCDKYIVILGISKDKDVTFFCRYLETFAKEIHLAKSDHPRLAAPDIIFNQFSENIPIYKHENFSNAMKSVINKENEQVLVLGSFYFMHEVKKALNIESESDLFNFNELIPKT